MSYEDHIEMFWERVRELKLDTTQIALWLALLEEWRKAGFPTRYSVPNEVLCDLLSVNIRTLRAARKRLIENGLVVFEEGNARKQPIYIVGVVAVVPKPPAIEVPKPKPKQKRVKVADGQLSLFSEKDMERPKKVKARAEPPSRAVVLMECRRKGMDDIQAQEFYDYYNAQGWVTSSGQRIKNVDSMINRWLTKQKKIDDESNRRFVPEQRPSVADNIRDAQQWAYERMSGTLLKETDGVDREFPEGIPDHF